MFAIPTALWLLLAIPVIYYAYGFLVFYVAMRRRAKHIMKFPGVDPHPLWGHLHLFPELPRQAGIDKITEYCREHAPRLGKGFLGPFVATVSLTHPETVCTLLRTSEPKPLLVGGYKFAHPWLGDGLLISGGKRWGRNRRLLTPAFHFDILKPYMEINNKATEIFLDKVSKFAEKGESFEVFGHISLLTLDIILRCAFSYENDCQLAGDSHPYVQAVSYMADTMVYRLLRPWLYPDWIFFITPVGRKFKQKCAFVHSVSKEIIQSRRQTLAATGGAKPRKAKYLDFVDIILTAKDSDGKGLSDKEIRDEADTFLFEGHDTTASGISWSLYDMATNPEWQERCQQEIDEILQGRDSDDILWEDLPKLKTLTMCIKESLRLHTPVPFIERQTTKDMYIDGYYLPAGTVVDIQLYVLHHNSHVWPEPMAYRPERFDPDNPEKMDNYAFVPFSAGPRNCIGQNFAMHEMKSVVARILRRFKLELDPHHKVEHRIMVVMKTENGMYMKATARKVE